MTVDFTAALHEILEVLGAGVIFAVMVLAVILWLEFRG